MGTWSTAVFGSDAAADARDEWLELVREGTPADEATARVLSVYQDDDDERDIALFSLAATAWRHGRLSAMLRADALAAIASGRDLRRWQDEAPQLAARRRKVLSDLDAKLRGAQRAPTHLRPVPASRPAFPNGALLIVDLGGSRLAVCRVRDQPQRKGSISNFEPLRWDRSTEPSLAEARQLKPIAMEPLGSSTDPSGLRHQLIGPHRCGVVFRRGETRDERLRVILGVWPDLAPRTTTSHWSLSLRSWTEHLTNLVERRGDPLATPPIKDAVLELEPDDG